MLFLCCFGDLDLVSICSEALHTMAVGQVDKEF
jgi:hypothetical protein